MTESDKLKSAFEKLYKWHRYGHRVSFQGDFDVDEYILTLIHYSDSETRTKLRKIYPFLVAAWEEYNEHDGNKRKFFEKKGLWNPPAEGLDHSRPTHEKVLSAETGK